MRSGRVYFKGIRAGTVWQNEDGYGFQYSKEYLDRADAEPVSLTLPLSVKPFLSKTMIPFFDGLIPEGWLLDVAIQNWKLDNRDRMGLLLVACKDCIGAVSIESESESENE